MSVTLTDEEVREIVRKLRMVAENLPAYGLTNCWELNAVVECHNELDAALTRAPDPVAIMECADCGCTRSRHDFAGICVERSRCGCRGWTPKPKQSPALCDQCVASGRVYCPPEHQDAGVICRSCKGTGREDTIAFTPPPAGCGCREALRKCLPYIDRHNDHIASQAAAALAACSAPPMADVSADEATAARLLGTVRGWLGALRDRPATLQDSWALALTVRTIAEQDWDGLALQPWPEQPKAEAPCSYCGQVVPTFSRVTYRDHTTAVGGRCPHSGECASRAQGGQK